MELQICPEGMEIARTYLTTQDVGRTAELLGVDASTVTAYLKKPEVRALVDQVYLDSGYRNRFKLAAVVDELVEAKLREMNEAEISTSKDILEVLQFAHKMRMDEIKAMTDLEKVRAGTTVKKQTNVQINDSSGSTNLTSLLDKLLKE